MNHPSWWRYLGTGTPHEIEWPDPPPWRRFKGEVLKEPDRGETDPDRGGVFQATPEMIDVVNTALYLRRPILLTGKPGTGKSSLAYAVAHELQLGRVLEWPITTRTTLTDGLYRYDAIGRLQEQQVRKKIPDIGPYLRLGALGTALLPSTRPRVLLIDEIDKSDIDLPNDLLHIFEEGRFEIPELTRLAEQPTHQAQRASRTAVRPWDSVDPIPIKDGMVTCKEFPIVVLTSNGEREFPPAFLRRCLRLTLRPPGETELLRIVTAHFNDLTADQRSAISDVVSKFMARRKEGELSTDQLLNAVYLTLREIKLDRETLIATVWKHLNQIDTLEDQ